jgi:hypothetical protein
MRPLSAERGAWFLGAAGLLGAVAGWVEAPGEFPHAWLAAVTCFLMWPLGSLALVMMHALTGGQWGYAIRPQLTAGIATLPLVVPALLPLPFVAGALYPWMHANVAAQLDNRFYLNVPFFYIRETLYVVIWLALAVVAIRALRKSEPQVALYRAAPVTLILLMLTLTFAAIDSTLSLEPHFKSSIYGMLVCVEAVLFSLSIAITIYAWTARVSENPAIKSSTRVLGRMLLAVLVLWAYLDFMQLLIVWNSDLPDEAAWYLHRLVGGWARVAIVIACLHFALPFFALIWSPVQRSPAVVGALAALLAFMEVPRVWWTVLPAAGRGICWVDGATMIALFGFAAAVALRYGRGLPNPKKASVDG